MTKRRGFSPTWVSAPGDTIADVLTERRISIEEFARQLGETVERTEALIQGKAPITIGTARKLNSAIGATIEYWMSRDFQYREQVAQLREEGRDWLRDLPIRDMVRFGWIERVRPDQELEAALRFFNVASLQEWHAKYKSVEALAAFRSSASFESRAASVAAWLRRGEIEAERIECAAWDPVRFEASLRVAKRLTRNRHPNAFIPQLRQICAECGVAVVVVRYPNGCRASGAARFISPLKGLMQFSFRHMSDDQFWFTFFHESAHLLRHPHKGIFIEGIETDGTREEREADKFASDFLLPSEIRGQITRQQLTTKSIIRLAQRAGVSPGIVVGQLQHEGVIGYNRFNSLKRRFVWSE